MNIFTIPEGIKESFPDKLHIDNHENSHIWFDLHLPLHDKELVEMAIKHALLNKVKRLYLGGDALNLGWASSFIGATDSDPEDTEREFKVCEDVFRTLLDVYDEIYLIGGNHDQGRWEKIIGGKIGFERMLKMVLGDYVVLNITTTGRRYMTVDTPSGIWRISHQAGKGRKRQLSAVEELASILQQNVAIGHQHYLGQCIERTGKYWSVDGGCMCNESLMEYKNIMDTLHTQWASGFVHLDEYGIPRCWFKKDLKMYLERGAGNGRKEI